MSFIKKIKRRLIEQYKLHKKKMSYMDIKIEEWRSAGISVGKNCRLYNDRPINRDAFLLQIGDNVTVSGGVIFLCHDNAPIKVSKGKYTDVFGKISIGNNCFIGHSSVILPGVMLADDTIVGAGSVVVHSQKESGYVIAGCPARVVCSIDEYYAKNEQYMVSADEIAGITLKEYFDLYPNKLITK